MFSELFAGLAAKVMGGIIVALLLSNVSSCVIKNREIRNQAELIARYKVAAEKQRAEIATLRGNVAQLDAGLKVCNASVENTARVADAVAKAGVSALKEVQKAGKAVDRKVREIDAMPKDTCEDAFKILKKR